MHVVDINSITDADLLFDLSKGDRVAFDILYNRYWKKVFNLAYKRVNDREIAEDIAQDIFVQLWIRGNATVITDLQAYLYTATRNGVFNRIGIEGKYTEIPEHLGVAEQQADEADSKIIYKEFFDAFQKMIDNLPEQQRVIFNLRFVESLSSNEIAERLQLSPKTVRNHIGRALATLKSELLFSLFLIVLTKGKN